MADTFASLRARIKELEDGQPAQRTMGVWEGGMGNRIARTLATDEAEAIGNLVEADPMLLSIGCFAAPMDDVDGFPVVCCVSDDYMTGSERRNHAVLG